MGNRAAGGMIAALVKSKCKRHPFKGDRKAAMRILDAAIEKSKTMGSFSSDAEFGDGDDTDRPLGKLIFEAFAPNGLGDIAEYDRLNFSKDMSDGLAFDTLHNVTYGEFRKRYNLI